MTEKIKKPSDHAVVVFARMNPPHKGHLKLIKRVKELAAHYGADHHVFLSPTHDSEKNPLTHEQKMKYLEELAPGTNIHPHKNITNPYEMLNHLHGKGYRKITLVAGQDRFHEMNNLLKRYNQGNKFHSVNVSSAGERDPDNEGVKGVSATKMRDAAKHGDFKTFKKGLGGKKITEEIFISTREGLGIVERTLAKRVWRQKNES